MLRKTLYFCIFVYLCSCRTWASDIDQLKQTKELGIKRAKFVQEKWNKLLKEQPELKRYISRPSTRDLLKNLREGKQGVDTLYVLGIRVEFQPDTETGTTGNGLMDIHGNEYPYDSLGHKTNRRANPPSWVGNDNYFSPFDSIVGDKGYHNLYYDPPHTKRYFEHLLEFLQNYYWDISGHKLWVEYKVVPEAESLSYKLPYKLTYYGDPENYMRGILTLFKDAVSVCDKESPEIDFSKYARNSGGVIVFHAGASWQTDYFGDSNYDIPDCFISGIDGYFGQPIWTDGGTVPIVDGMLYSETACQDGMYGFLQGGLCHEFGHQLGLFDLYDISGKSMGIGGWALMGTGNWNLNGLLPPAICAWNSEHLGFVKPIELTKDTTSVSIYQRCGLDTNVTTPKIYKVPINTKEYFLVEERFVDVSKDTTVYKFEYSEDSILHIDSTGIRVWKDGILTSFSGYYDWGLPPDSGMGGLAIWHIDEDKIASDSLYNEINVGSPKGVDMEEADGIQDFEIPPWLATDGEAFFYGSKWDVFYDGNNAQFTPYTAPNTNDNSSSISHISIYNISKPDTMMSFSVKFDMKYANFPVNCGGVFDVNSPNIAEVDGKPVIFTGVLDTNEIVRGGNTAFVGGVIYAYHSDGTLFWADTTLAKPGATNPFGTNLFSSIAIGDIDGNGVLDIVTTPFVVWRDIYGKGEALVKYNKAKSDTFRKIEGKLCAWDVYGNQLFAKDSITDGAIIGAPLLADITGDGKDEIIFGSEDSRLRVFDGSGDTLWTKDLHDWIWATPVWDSTSQTLYACAMDGKLWAISQDGTTKWTAIKPRLSRTTSSPVVGDLDRDGSPEIIVNTGDGKVYCVSEDGEIKWERVLDDTSFYSSPALADIDRDKFLDIVIAAGNKIYVLNNNGANVPGFPVNTGASKDLQSSPVIRRTIFETSPSIPGSGGIESEIIIGSPDGKLLAYNNKGDLVSGFPLSVGGAIYSTPLLANLQFPEHAGLITREIIVGCDDGKLYGWSVGEANDLLWPSLHRNSANNGIYEKLSPLSPSPASVFKTSDFYVYPNPIRDRGWVHYFSGDAKDVDIKIINLAGEVVSELKGKIGKKNYQDVLLPDIPSGVYLLRVEVDGNTRFKKFAVVK